MHLLRTRWAAGGLVAGLLLGGSGIAVAAENDALGLGKKNQAKKTTVIKNKKGTALRLEAKPGKPALSVNTQAKVPNLNADSVDGLGGEEIVTENELDRKALGARWNLATGSAGDAVITSNTSNGWDAVFARDVSACTPQVTAWGPAAQVSFTVLHTADPKVLGVTALKETGSPAKSQAFFLAVICP